MTLKSAFLASLCLFASISIANANNLPITITANESVTVTLFFPSEIEKVIEPSVNYKFEYAQHGTMGTLVARRGAKSNLTVITNDGSIFSFSLQYHHEVNNFTYVLSSNQAIGIMDPRGITTSNTIIVEPTVKSILTEKPLKDERPVKEERKKLQDGENSLKEKIKVSATQPSFVADSDTAQSDLITSSESAEELDDYMRENNLYNTDRAGYYDIFCENNFNQEVRLKKTLKAGTGVELQLNSIAGDNNELYFIFQVTNRLMSRFNAEKLRFYVRTSRKDEPLEMTPIHIFNHQESIEAGRTKKMVYVLKDFRLSKDQKVFVMLDEKDGNRNTILNIDSHTINAVNHRSIVAAR